MKRETLERFIQDYKGPNLAGDLARFIDSTERVKSYLRVFHQDERVEEKKYKEIQKEFHARLLGIQKMCQHPETTFYGDASGGNDHKTCCDICGKEV